MEIKIKLPNVIEKKHSVRFDCAPEEKETAPVQSIYVKRSSLPSNYSKGVELTIKVG